MKYILTLTILITNITHARLADNLTQCKAEYGKIIASTNEYYKFKCSKFETTVGIYNNQAYIIKINNISIHEATRVMQLHGCKNPGIYKRPSACVAGWYAPQYNQYIEYQYCKQNNIFILWLRDTKTKANKLYNP